MLSSYVCLMRFMFRCSTCCSGRAFCKQLVFRVFVFLFLPQTNHSDLKNRESCSQSVFASIPETNTGLRMYTQRKFSVNLQSPQERNRSIPYHHKLAMSAPVSIDVCDIHDDILHVDDIKTSCSQSSASCLGENQSGRRQQRAYHNHDDVAQATSTG